MTSLRPFWASARETYPLPLLSNPRQSLALALTYSGSVLLIGNKRAISPQSTPLLFCFADGLEAGIFDPPIVLLPIRLAAVPGLAFLPVLYYCMSFLNLFCSIFCYFSISLFTFWYLLSNLLCSVSLNFNRSFKLASSFFFKAFISIDYLFINFASAVIIFLCLSFIYFSRSIFSISWHCS